jgi:PAS domain S-box-containing protein
MSGAGAGAYLVRIFCKRECPLFSGTNVLILVLVGAIAGCVISPTVGVVSLWLGGYIPWQHFGYSWITWWAGDATGAIVAAPLILAWTQPSRFRGNPWKGLEATVLGGGAVMLCTLVFFRKEPFAYCLMPLLLWAAFRFGMRGVTTTAAMIAILATVGTSQGGSSFVTGTVNDSLLALHAFLDVTIVCALFVAGVLAERQRAEKVLQESEIRHRFLFEHNPLPMLIYERGTLQILAVNEAFVEQYGYSYEEALALCLPELYPDDEKKKIAELIPKLHGHANVGEWHHRKRDGSFITNLVFSHDLEYQGRNARVAVLTDITERKQAEITIQRERDFSDIALNSLPGVFYCYDESLRFRRWNKNFERVTGYAAAELARLSPLDLFAGADKGLLAQRIREVFEHGTAEVEADFVTKDGRHIPYYFTGLTTEIDGQRHLVGMGIDIAARKRVEQELRDTQANLEERVFLRTTELAVAKEHAELADRLKSAFLATMSHELRTPLNSIIGFTGIILQGLAGPLNQEQRKQLEMVRNSARHLLALINDVLDISKIVAGQIEIAPAPVDLPEAIAKVMSLVAPLAEKRGLQLIAQLAPEVAQITSDRRRVEQILLNLLSNAIKFTDHGGVTLAAARVAAGIRIAVSDTGAGIKSEDLNKLFQPFRQLDTGLSRQHEGTGLGLAICKRLVERLGGTISVTSEWGAGSTFQFVLPVELESERKP